MSNKCSYCSNSELEKLLIDGAWDLGIKLNTQQVWMFETYTSILLDWNKRVNLTSIIDPKEIAIKHYLDSLTCLVAGIPENAKVIDVGTGAGFPGMPLKIVRQDLDLTLLDSTKKKLHFLDAVCSELGFLDIELLHGRAEEAGKDEIYREGFDMVLSRAVTEIKILAEYCLPLTRVGGFMLAQKGPDVVEELKEGKKAIETLGGSLAKVIPIKVPCSDYKRNIVLVEKIGHTPCEYPRTQAKIAKNPI